MKLARKKLVGMKLVGMVLLLRGSREILEAVRIDFGDE
jgi:hypothetical protein